MRTENLSFFRDMAEELAELAKSDGIETLAYIFGMAKIETINLKIAAAGEPGHLKKRLKGMRRRVSAEANIQGRDLPSESVEIDLDDK
ncbi:MAG TPA: hypothetical protein VGH13_08220 [Xanthobacteraceae bacterium]|jgi:hypothetical protein